ncbi:MAG: THUMP domain-containing protein [Candidatus Kariarchaeaceae archaeon]|jgi:tRNA acetyltransferase TAN1
MPLHRGLLVSCKRNFENSASSEIHFALVSKLKIDKSKIHVSRTGISGLLTVKLDAELDFDKIMEELIALEDENSFFMHCLKVRPVQRTTNSDIEHIQKVGLDLAKNIVGKFRITITKRHSTLSSKEIITAIASNIDNKVDLENPDWILLVEILANKAGISIIKPHFIYSTKKAFDENEENEINWFLN